MLITSFQVKNFKSFLASEEIQFGPGFNIVVGQNNVGKTALIETLSLQFGNNPHRSLSTNPTGMSSVVISYRATDKEWLRSLKDLGPVEITVRPGRTAQEALDEFEDLVQTRLE